MTNEITLDVRGLEPPEPLERVLESLSTLKRDQVLRMIIDREPFPLYSMLDLNGYRHTTEIRDDYRYEILISHKG